MKIITISKWLLLTVTMTQSILSLSYGATLTHVIGISGPREDLSYRLPFYKTYSNLPIN